MGRTGSLEPERAPMPIRPENKNRYPKNWKSEIVPRIRARSGNRCECTGQCGVKHDVGDFSLPPRCGVANGDIGIRKDGEWHSMPWERVGSFVESYRVVTIVLTVMHLDHTPENCADENLLHACQRCHNRYDAPMRRRGIAERAKAKRASGDLFKCEGVS